MSEILKNGLRLFGKTLIVWVMCFFICISISVLATGLFTENIGYDAYGVKEGSEESVKLYTYLTESGEDTQKAEYESQGYKISTVGIRSELTKTGNRVYLTVTQLINLSLLFVFVYPQLWQLGCKDSNLVRFKHKTEDIFKGLKIGAVAAVPSLAVYILMVILAVGVNPELPSTLYRFINVTFLPLIQLICGTSALGELAVWQFVCLFLLLLVMPAIAFGAYLLGYKDISLGERFVYKKKKN